MAIPKNLSKYGAPSVFNPSDYLNYAKTKGLFNGFPIPRSVVMLFYDHVYFEIKKNHPGRETKAFFRLHTIEKDGFQIGICGGFGIGAPAATIALEELIALGVTEFINVGSAGSLQRHVPLGSMVLPTRAIRDEGTSHHYVTGTRFASPSSELLGRLRHTFVQSKIAFTEGPIWTTDAPYRESVAEVTALQQEGILAVEMESSALYTVGDYRKVRVASLLNISDDLSSLRWDPRLHDPSVSEHIFNLANLAIETFRS